MPNSIPYPHESVSPMTAYMRGRCDWQQLHPAETFSRESGSKERQARPYGSAVAQALAWIQIGTVLGVWITLLDAQTIGILPRRVQCGNRTGYWIWSTPYAEKGMGYREAQNTGYGYRAQLSPQLRLGTRTTREANCTMQTALTPPKPGPLY